MAGYGAPPPDNAALPEFFRQSLPLDPQQQDRMGAAIEASVHAALAPASAPPLVVPPAPVAAPPRVAPPALAQPPAPRAQPRPDPRPDLNRMRSIADKAERDAPDNVHRSAFIRAVLTQVFGPNWLQNPDFQQWVAAARDLYQQGGAGRALAGSPFMALPKSHELDAALRQREVTRQGLTWSLLLGIVWGVWYCNDVERQHYRVHLGHPVTRGDDPEPFDSVDLSRKLGLAGAVEASAGAMACIWVIDDLDAAEPKMYSHICLIGRFHHSSFLGGADIGAGGEWEVRQGEVRLIGGSSGHYRPAPWRFMRALMILQRHNMIGDNTQVELFDGRQPHPVPAKAYIARPQDYPQERYTVHKPG